MLAELKEYANSNPNPHDAPAVELVVAYLDVLNKVFEKSLLDKKVRVFKRDGTTIQRMEEGFAFFAKWAVECEEEDENRKSFLSWQVSTTMYVGT